MTISREEGDASAAYRAGVPYYGQSLDVNQNWVTFDGRKLHAVLPFEGERFSLVFFCGPEAEKVPSAVRNELSDAGFDFDWDEASVSSAATACALPKAWGAVGSQVLERSSKAGQEARPALEGLPSQAPWPQSSVSASSASEPAEAQGPRLPSDPLAEPQLPTPSASSCPTLASEGPRSRRGLARR